MVIWVLTNVIVIVYLLIFIVEHSFVMPTCLFKFSTLNVSLIKISWA